MRPFKKSCVCEALGVRCVLGAQRHPPGLRVEDQHICGHQVPKSEGVTHPTGHGREAGWPGHSKDTHRRERAPWEDQQRERGRREQRSPNAPGLARLSLSEWAEGGRQGQLL